AALGEVHHADLSEQRVGVAVEGLTGASVRDVSFEMHEGEVVGLTGLVGSGFEDVPHLLYGARQAVAGVLAIRGAAIDLTRPHTPGGIGARPGAVPRPH